MLAAVPSMRSGVKLNRNVSPKISAATTVPEMGEQPHPLPAMPHPENATATPTRASPAPSDSNALPQTLVNVRQDRSGAQQKINVSPITNAVPITIAQMETEGLDTASPTEPASAPQEGSVIISV